MVPKPTLLAVPAPSLARRRQPRPRRHTQPRQHRPRLLRPWGADARAGAAGAAPAVGLAAAEAGWTLALLVPAVPAPQPLPHAPQARLPQVWAARATAHPWQRLDGLEPKKIFSLCSQKVVGAGVGAMLSCGSGPQAVPTHTLALYKF